MGGWAGTLRPPGRAHPCADGCAAWEGARPSPCVPRPHRLSTLDAPIAHLPQAPAASPPRSVQAGRRRRGAPTRPRQRTWPGCGAWEAPAPGCAAPTGSAARLRGRDEAGCEAGLGARWRAGDGKHARRAGQASSPCNNKSDPHSPQTSPREGHPQPSLTRGPAGSKVKV